MEYLGKRSEIERSIQRVKKILPEMECAKQLSKIVKYYKKGDKVLDFGCASGHFYLSLKKIDKDISYYGFDATKPYVRFAKKFFKNNPNTYFEIQNIFLFQKNILTNLILFFALMYYYICLQ